MEVQHVYTQYYCLVALKTGSGPVVTGEVTETGSISGGGGW